MEIIAEFPADIVNIRHYHDDDDKIITLLCSSKDHLYIYKEEQIVNNCPAQSIAFPLISYVYQHNDILLTADALHASELLKLDKLFVVDKETMFGLASNGKKLLRISPEFYDCLVSNEKEMNVFDFVTQVVTLQTKFDPCLMVKVERGGDKTAQISPFAFTFEDSLYLALFGYNNFVKRSVVLLLFGSSGQIWYVNVNDLNSCTFFYSLDTTCSDVRVISDDLTSSFICSTCDGQSFQFTTGEQGLYSVTKTWLTETKDLSNNVCLSTKQFECSNHFRVLGNFFIKENSMSKDDANEGMKLEDIEHELHKVHQEIQTAKASLYEKVQAMKFHQKVMSPSKQPTFKVSKHDVKKLTVNLSNSFYDPQHSDFYLHAISHGTGSISTSVTSSTNTIDMSSFVRCEAQQLVIASTVQSYAACLGSTDFKLLEMVKISEDERFLNHPPVNLFHKRLCVHKSFTQKFTSFKEFLFGPVLKPMNNRFVLHLLEQDILVSIKVLPGHNQIWQFSSTDIALLTYVFNSYLRKVHDVLL